MDKTILAEILDELESIRSMVLVTSDLLVIAHRLENTDIQQYSSFLESIISLLYPHVALIADSLYGSSCSLKRLIKSSPHLFDDYAPSKTD